MEWRHKRYSELWIQLQAYQMDRWTHTAKLQQIHLSKPVPYYKLNPYVAVGIGRVGMPVSDKPVFKIIKPGTDPSNN
jgi:hypothetical protein